MWVERRTRKPTDWPMARANFRVFSPSMGIELELHIHEIHRLHLYIVHFATLRYYPGSPLSLLCEYVSTSRFKQYTSNGLLTRKLRATESSAWYIEKSSWSRTLPSLLASALTVSSLVLATPLKEMSCDCSTTGSRNLLDCYRAIQVSATNERHGSVLSGMIHNVLGIGVPTQFGVLGLHRLVNQLVQFRVGPAGAHRVSQRNQTRQW
jgi:hypothetical protein